MKQIVNGLRFIAVFDKYGEVRIITKVDGFEVLRLLKNR